MKLNLHQFLELNNGETKMPNNTLNEVIIQTNTNEEQEILALQILRNDLGIGDGTFDFNGIVPMPKEIKKSAEISVEDFLNGEDAPDGYENINGHYVPKDLVVRNKLIKDHGADNWYDWSCNNWGTKWNSYEVEVHQDKESILEIDFSTAWDSPRGVVEKIFDYCQDHNLALSWVATHEGEEGFEQII